MSFSRILCAIDTDPLADSVFEIGFELAEKLGSEIALVSIVDQALLYPGEGAMSVIEMRAFRKSEIEQLFARLIQKQNTSRIIAKFSQEGNPKKHIVEIASNWKADLIIIASHGRHGISRVLLGSVAESVVHNSGCPVLIVPAHHR